jgi:hypothetical protein
MLSTGFMLLMPSQTMTNFLLDWEAALGARDRELQHGRTGGKGTLQQLGVNQPIFNQELWVYRKSNKLKVRALPIGFFPSGSVFFGHPKWMSTHPTPVSIHINFVVGVTKKRAYLMKNGFWLV